MESAKTVGTDIYLPLHGEPNNSNYNNNYNKTSASVLGKKCRMKRKFKLRLYLFICWICDQSKYRRRNRRNFAVWLDTKVAAVKQLLLDEAVIFNY